jgi:invasion protein IalB
MKLFSSVVILTSLLAWSVVGKGSAFAQADSAPAQSNEGWTKLCVDAPAEAARERASPRVTAKETVTACYTYATIRDVPTQITVGHLGVLQTQPSGRSFLIAFLPLGSALAPAMYVQLDGAERIQLGYFLPGTCDQSGCFQRAIMSPALLERLRNAKTIAVGGFDVTGREHSLPLPCCSFKAAFDGAPTPVGDKYDEPRKITETLRRHFADFTRKDWEKLCFDVSPGRGKRDGNEPSQETTAGKRSEACYTYTEVRDWKSDATLAYIGVLETKEPGRRVVASLFPNFSITPRDPGLIQLDWGWFLNHWEIKLAYLAPQACDVGCYARADMSEQLLDRLVSATHISFRRSEGMEKQHFLVPCCGFGGALNGAPVAPADQDEKQRKIQESLRQHFADFMP